MRRETTSVSDDPIRIVIPRSNATRDLPLGEAHAS